MIDLYQYRVYSRPAIYNEKKIKQNNIKDLDGLTETMEVKGRKHSDCIKLTSVTKKNKNKNNFFSSFNVLNFPTKTQRELTKIYSLL